MDTGRAPRFRGSTTCTVTVHGLWTRGTWGELARISPDGHATSTIDRQVLALAVPALGALVAEPLFVLVDTAIVGHLGPAPLAGLGLASTVLATVVGLCVFLAYATTATVARRLGAGDEAGALRSGIDSPCSSRTWRARLSSSARLPSRSAATLSQSRSKLTC